MPDNNTVLPGAKLPKLSLGNNVSKIPAFGSTKLPSLGNDKNDSKKDSLASLNESIGASENRSGLDFDSINLDEELDNVWASISSSSKSVPKKLDSKIESKPEKIESEPEKIESDDKTVDSEAKLANSEAKTVDSTELSEPVAAAPASILPPKSSQIPKITLPPIGIKHNANAGSSILPPSSDSAPAGIKIPKSSQPNPIPQFGLGGLGSLANKQSFSLSNAPKTQDEKEELESIPASEISAALDLSPAKPESDIDREKQAELESIPASEISAALDLSPAKSETKPEPEVPEPPKIPVPPQIPSVEDNSDPSATQALEQPDFNKLPLPDEDSDIGSTQAIEQPDFSKLPLPDEDSDIGSTQAIEQPDFSKLPLPDEDSDIGSTQAIEQPDFSKLPSPGFPIPTHQNPSPGIPVTPGIPASPQPMMGGAAGSNNDDELQWEDEEAGDLGEKTMTIDSFVDDEDLEEGDGEKTQINMSAMDDFEPLSGKLIVESGKTSQREYILVRDETTIGRASKNDIAISDISMSRHHVAIDKFPEGFRLRDLESGNGTILNGYRIRVAQLRNGDIIEVGSIRFRFEQTGGDPDDLWKGEPKIEFHPNQSHHKSSQNNPSVAAASAASTPAAEPQMESMLERKNSISSVPAWAAAPQMTSPYVMSYNGGPIKDTNSAPLWSSILLILLILVMLASIVLCGFSWYELKTKKDDLANLQTYIEKMNQDVKTGVTAYSELRFQDAISNIQSARDIGKEYNLVDESNFFEFYLEFINEEENISKEVKNIRYPKVRRTSLEDYENAIEVLSKISDASINKPMAVSTMNLIMEDYSAALQKHINTLITSGKTNEAREELAKLRKLPNSSKAVQDLSKFIADKEKSTM